MDSAPDRQPALGDAMTVQLSDLIDSAGLLIAAFALIFSIWVSYLALSQSRQMFENETERSMLEFERSRFDELVNHAKEILLRAGEIDSYIDWRHRELDEISNVDDELERRRSVTRASSELSQLIQLLNVTKNLMPERISDLPHPESISRFGYHVDPLERLLEQASFLVGISDLVLRYQAIEAAGEAGLSVREELPESDEHGVALINMRVIENLGDLVPGLEVPEDAENSWVRLEKQRRWEVMARPHPDASKEGVLPLARTVFLYSLTTFRTSLNDLLESYVISRHRDVAKRRQHFSRFTKAKGVAFESLLPSSAKSDHQSLPTSLKGRRELPSQLLPGLDEIL